MTIPQQIQVQTDYLGIIVGIVDEIGLVEQTNQLLDLSIRRAPRCAGTVPYTYWYRS